mmetsp:Transcript_41247/g.106703  ORF Transcript_41247/g.106703 Transcript_41247/m.106703 type:complete len:107 (+) Transcript_41247:1720-2040(+)
MVLVGVKTPVDSSSSECNTLNLNTMFLCTVITDKPNNRQIVDENSLLRDVEVAAMRAENRASAARQLAEPYSTLSDAEVMKEIGVLLTHVDEVRKATAQLLRRQGR